MEDACHNRGAFTATVVKVTGTEGHRGGGLGVGRWVNATLNGRLCIHRVLVHSLLPSTCACS